MGDRHGCVFVVTDTGIRGDHPASWATGRLVDEYHDLTDADAPAWEHFIRSVDGSRDLQVDSRATRIRGGGRRHSSSLSRSSAPTWAPVCSRRAACS